MADSFVRLPPDSTGSKLGTKDRVQGADTVHDQTMLITDGSGNTIGATTGEYADADRGLRVRGYHPDRLMSGTITAAAQTVEIDTRGGYQTTSIDLRGTFTGTSVLAVEATTDGTNWFAVVIKRDDGSGQGSNLQPPIAAYFTQCAAYRAVRVRCTTFQAADSISVTLRASVAPRGVELFDVLSASSDPTAFHRGLYVRPFPSALTAGTRVGRGQEVQQVRDSGRNERILHTTAPVTPTASDALVSLTGWYSNAAVAATTTPTVVPAGKKYRINSIDIWGSTSAATIVAGFVTITLRMNTAGVVAIGSPVVRKIHYSPSGAAMVASMPGPYMQVTWPEGFEVPAAAGIGLSIQGFTLAAGFATAGAPTVGVSISVNGYEY